MSTQRRWNRAFDRLAILAAVPLVVSGVGLASMAAQSDKDKADDDDGKMVIHGSLFTNEDVPRISYVLVKEGEESTSGSGEIDDYKYARKLRDRYHGDFLYIRQGQRRYVVRDHDAIDDVRNLMDPMERIGRQQAEAGAHQAEIGARQAAIGAEQAKLGAKQGKLGARQAVLSAEIAEAAAEGRSARRYREELASVAEEMRELGREQGKLGQRMAVISREMEPYSREQGRLGKEQGRASRILQDYMEDSIPEWIRSGRAESID